MRIELDLRNNRLITGTLIDRSIEATGVGYFTLRFHTWGTEDEALLKVGTDQLAELASVLAGVQVELETVERELRMRDEAAASVRDNPDLPF